VTYNHLILCSQHHIFIQIKTLLYFLLLRVLHINYNEYLSKFPIRKVSASVEKTAFAPLSGKILVSHL